MSSTPSPTTGLPTALQRDLEQVAGRYADEQVAVAVLPVGADADREVEVVADADPERLFGWSTTKVPVALAADRAADETSAPTITADTELALTISDNDAAYRLWATLGGGQVSADAVEDILREAGDSRTQVPPNGTTEGYTPFGQTRWGIADQARFAAGLPCLDGAKAVTGPMGEIQESQRWGFGAVDGAIFKGGWGPTDAGYVVRQMAVIPDADGGRTAVTMQTVTPTFEEGTAVLDEIAAVIAEHQQQLPGGRCG